MDNLFWLPFQRLYHQLQTSHGGLPIELSKELNDKHFDWLLEGPLRFKPQQQSSSQAIFAPGAKSVTVHGKKLAIQPKLLDATGKLSSLLDLDAFQSHLVIRRWVKETGQESLLEGLTATQQLQFDDATMLEVVQYYQQERLSLLRSLQYIQLQGCVDGPFTLFLDRLVKGGLEDRLVNLLRANVEQHAALLQQQQQPTSRPGAATATGASTSQGGAASSTTGNSSVVPTTQQPAGQPATTISTELLIGAHRAHQEQVVVERCELLVCLLLLYETQTDLQCKSQRVVELARLLAQPLLQGCRSSGVTTEQLHATVAALEQSTRGVQSNNSSQVLTQPQQTAVLAECLSCTLLLCVIDVPAYLSMVQAGTGPADTPSSPDNLPLGGKTRDLHAEVCAWPGRVGSVMLFTTWAALTRLMEPYVDLGEGSGEALLAAATGCGLFSSAALLVQLSQLLLTSSTSQMCRGVTLKALCGVATAFELGPARQNAQELASLWQLLKLLLQDDAGLCEGLWDSQQQHLHLQPLRALLKEAASFFPAISGPYLQLLTYLSAGPTAAAAAYQHLQVECGLVCLHHMSEPGLFSAGGSSVQLSSKLAWNQAPSVSTMLLPAGIQGKVLPMPELLLPQHDPHQWALVRWEVDGTHPSFGQLLLLGRTAHVLHVMEACMYKSQEPNPSLLQDLVITLAALSAMASQQPACVDDLLSISVDAPGSTADAAGGPLSPTPKFTWLNAAANSLQLLARLADAYSNQASGSKAARFGNHEVQAAVLKGMGHALALLKSIAEQKPTSVLAALQLLPAEGAGTLTLPTYVPLAAVLSAALVPGGAWLAAPPCLLHLPLECQLQDFSATQALLQLVTSFLRQGYVQGAVPGLVLTTLLRLLPEHMRWTYNSPADRWLLQCAILQVLEAAITAGSCLHAIRYTQLTGLPDASDVSVTGLAAAILSHLLNHGDALLLDSLTPSVDDLEQLQAADPASPLLPACEQAMGRLLQLLPLLIAAARAVKVDCALEERLLLGLAGEQLPPATLLTSLLAYTATPAGTPALTHQTLRFVLALQDCVVRNQDRTGLPLSSVLPPASTAHAALQHMISVEMADQDPDGLLLALRVLEGCIPHHPQLLDSLLPAPPPPSTGGEQQATGNKLTASGQQAAAQQPVGSERLLALLEACLHPQQGEPPDSADEAACAVVCVLAALWQHPTTSPRILAELRSSSRLWHLLEQCIHGGLNSPVPTANTSDAATAAASPAAQLAAGIAWQVVSLEATRYPRTQLTASTATTAAMPRLLLSSADAARAPNAAALPVWAVIDRLLDKRTVHKVLLWHAHCCEDLPALATRMGCLLLALELELGADAVARDTPAEGTVGAGQATSGPALLAPSVAAPSSPTQGGAVLAAQGVEDRVSSAPALRQELQPLAALLQQGTASSQHLEQLHDALLTAANPDQPDTNLAALTMPPLAALHGKLALTGAGAALLSSCMRPGMQLLTRAAGPALTPCVWVDLLDADQLAKLLGPGLCSGLYAAEALQQLLSSVQQHMMTVQAALCAQHAATALCTVLLHDNTAAKALLQQVTAPASSGMQGQAQHQLPVHGLLATLLSQHVQLVSTWTAKQPIMVVQESNWGQACQAVCLAGMQQTMQLLLLTLSKASTAASGKPAAATGSGHQAGTPATGTAAASGLAVLTSMDASMCMTLLDGLVQWLAVSSTMPSSLHMQAMQVAGGLARACSLALTILTGNNTASTQQASNGNSAAAAAANPDMILLQQKMLAALLPVWSACENGQLDADAGLQVVVQMVLRHLQPYEWLPVLQSHMDISRLLETAAEQLVSGAQEQDQQEAEVGMQAQPQSLGALRLALLAAQLPEGAAWLHNAGVLPGLTRLAQQLLAAQGRALSEFTAVSMILQPAAMMSANHNPLMPRPPSITAQASTPSGRLSAVTSTEYSDTAGAYVRAPNASRRPVSGSSCGTWQWAPFHLRWCTLLGFSGSLIRTLGQYMDVEQDAIDLLCVCEARLLQAVLPPAASSIQPLTLADTAERERALFLLTQMARYTGTWHMARPASLTQFRAAAVSFLAFASQASRPQVNVECPPMTDTELQMAGQHTGLPRTEGWFRVCALASSDLLTQPTAPATPALAGGSAATSSTPSGLLSPASPAAATTCSEFAARLAEAVYTCTHYALVFLQTTAPQVGEGERGNMLGPGWPRVKELVALQDHTAKALFSMVDVQRAPMEPRRVRCARHLIKVLQSVCDLLEIVGSSVSRAVLTAKLREQLPVIDQALQRGEAVPLPSSSMMARMQSTASTTLTEPQAAA